MIIQLLKKLKTLPNNSYNRHQFIILFSFTLLSIQILQAQSKDWYKPERIGFMYGYGHQGGIFLDDKDYSYSSNIIKLQFYYPIREGKFNLDLEFEPTLGFSKHQLLNFYFIQPFETDYLAKREEFTKSKLITEYILNTNFILSHTLFNTVNAYIFIGFGPMYINKRTERLAKGFAFADNFGAGINYNIINSLNIDIRGSLRHLSNAELNHPNSGINIATVEIGMNFRL